MQTPHDPTGHSDAYRRPSARATAETRVKGSRFIAEVIPVRDPAGAGAGLDGVRRRWHDATHHCSAWRLGPAGSPFRFDDDGEPSGSAGLPILRQIEAAALFDALVVVTRWFGGTKLGTGGLVRAYGDAAREALMAVPVEECILRVRFVVDYAFEDTSPALHCLTRFDIERGELHYDERTRLEAAVRSSQADAFEKAWVEALRGRGGIRRVTADGTTA